MSNLSKVDRVIRALLVDTLAETHWNKRRTAALLDISRPTVDAWIERFAVTREEVRDASALRSAALRLLIDVVVA